MAAVPELPPLEALGRPRELTSHAIEVLRIGAGIVWFVNLLFILDPANAYWSTFSATALGFALSTVGGPGFAEYVAAHSLFFSWAIAVLTGYLAVALTFGLTTRIASFAGAIFSAILLATQFGTTFLFPGGTDVGAHPLYILVYAVLVVGGAGRYLSVDSRIERVLARRYADRLARRAASDVTPGGTPARSTPVVPVFSVRQLATYFVVGVLLAFGVGFGLVLAVPIPGASSGSGSTPVVADVNLTVSINPANGWPQFSPANFSVPRGAVLITIVDNDMAMAWSGCPCPVRGTLGGEEQINGQTVGVVPAANVAHSFDIPQIGLAVFSPGQSVVQFEVEFGKAGQLLWYCVVPCGTGTNPYNTPPMGVLGYMEGTVTVL